MSGMLQHSSQRTVSRQVQKWGAGSGDLCTPAIHVAFSKSLIFSYLGYADSTDSILHSCFDLLLAEAASLSLCYSLYPVRKEQMKLNEASLTEADILSLENFQDIASSSLLRVH